MSNKVYSILSNNKEHGPYSLEEVLQLSLKPHDLVWVEGGTSWRSPSEIEALKAFTSIPENNPQKNEAISSRIFFSYPKISPPPEVTNARPGTPLTHSTDREREEDREEIEEEPIEESLEMKAEKIYQRVLAYNDQKQLRQENPSSERIDSLQELRQEKTLWHKQQKKKESTKNKKRLLMQAGAAVIIITSGIFIVMRSTGIEKKTSTTPQLYITNSINPVTTKKINNVTSGIPKNEQNIKPAFIEKDSLFSTPLTKPGELSVDEFIDSVRLAMAKQDILNSFSRKKKSNNKR